MKLSKSKSITINALLCAIVLLMIVFPIRIGPISLAFIPLVAVIISAEFVGLKNGIITGLFFGIVTCVYSWVSPTNPLYFAFRNPLVTVLPRIVIGLSAYFSMKGFGKLFPKLPPVFSYTIGSIAGVITNTVLVLGMILLLYYGKSVEEMGSAISFGLIGAIILTNSILELVVCSVVTPPIVLALKKAFHINK